jgi:drug/metabolite transporter (DMT)-like permease
MDQPILTSRADAAPNPTMSRTPVWYTLALTLLALVAFAGNSLLCRQALQHSAIDAASFSSLRLAAGAAMLAGIVRWRAAAAPPARRDGWAAFMLFAYVACFSFAYDWLDAATGALILFGAVQVTMFAAGLSGRERLSGRAWVGVAAALAGLVYLVSPGLSAPAPQGAALMAAAGLAWGVYSLRGRTAGDPLTATAGNFLLALPMALVVSTWMWHDARVDAPGVVLALASGAITSGLGYVVWYAVVPRLGALRAATAQLAVPPLAALGGVLWLSEPVTPRLLLASVAILGGIALVLTAQARAAR